MEKRFKIRITSLNAYCYKKKLLLIYHLGLHWSEGAEHQYRYIDRQIDRYIDRQIDR